MINKNKNIQGFTLILSLVLLIAMSLMGGTLIVLSSSDHRDNNNDDLSQQAFYVAETGLLEAEKYLVNSFLGLPRRAIEDGVETAVTDSTPSNALTAISAAFRVGSIAVPRAGSTSIEKPTFPFLTTKPLTIPNVTMSF